MEAKKNVKVKVLKKFNDRITKERRDVNKTYDYSEERAKELEKNGYVEIMKTAEAKKGE